MKFREDLFLITVWVGILLVLLRIMNVNMIGFTTTTLRWTNLAKPNTTFRWAAVPTAMPIAIDPDQPQTVKITVPRSFSVGQLEVSTLPGSGRLLVAIPAPSGRTTHVSSDEAGGSIIVTIDREDTALSNRTFSVLLTSEDADVEVRSMKLTLQRQ